MPTWRREKFVLSINELRAHALALARAARATKYNAAMRLARSGSRNGFEIKQLRRRGRSQRCYTPARETQVFVGLAPALPALIASVESVDNCNECHGKW